MDPTFWDFLFNPLTYFLNGVFRFFVYLFSLALPLLFIGNFYKDIEKKTKIEFYLYVSFYLVILITNQIYDIRLLETLEEILMGIQIALFSLSLALLFTLIVVVILYIVRQETWNKIISSISFGLVEIPKRFIIWWISSVICVIFVLVQSSIISNNTTKSTDNIKGGISVETINSGIKIEKFFNKGDRLLFFSDNIFIISMVDDTTKPHEYLNASRIHAKDVDNVYNQKIATVRKEFERTKKLIETIKKENEQKQYDWTHMIRKNLYPSENKSHSQDSILIKKRDLLQFKLDSLKKDYHLNIISGQHYVDTLAWKSGEVVIFSSSPNQQVLSETTNENILIGYTPHYWTISKGEKITVKSDNAFSFVLGSKRGSHEGGDTVLTVYKGDNETEELKVKGNGSINQTIIVSGYGIMDLKNRIGNYKIGFFIGALFIFYLIYSAARNKTDEYKEWKAEQTNKNKEDSQGEHNQKYTNESQEEEEPLAEAEEINPEYSENEDMKKQNIEIDSSVTTIVHELGNPPELTSMLTEYRSLWKLKRFDRALEIAIKVRDKALNLYRQEKELLKEKAEIDLLTRTLSPEFKTLDDKIELAERQLKLQELENKMKINDAETAKTIAEHEAEQKGHEKKAEAASQQEPGPVSEEDKRANERKIKEEEADFIATQRIKEKERLEALGFEGLDLLQKLDEFDERMGFKDKEI